MGDIWDKPTTNNEPVPVPEKEVPVIHWDKPKLKLDLHVDNHLNDKILLEEDLMNKFSNMLMVSSSSISKVLYKGEEIDYCPKKVESYLQGKNEFTSESMDKGNFFESLLLGGTRDGSKVLSLPRKEPSKKDIVAALKKGLPPPEPAMRVDEIRIRKQAELSKIKLFNHSVQIVENYNTQVPVFKKWNDNVMLVSHLDLFPTPLMLPGMDNPEIACIDVKLTIDLNNRFGNYCWGTPEFIDITQALFYYFILMDIDYSINPYLKKIVGSEKQFPNLLFAYFVAEYKSDEKFDSQFFPVRKTEMRMNEIQEIIRKTISIYEMHNENGWVTNPSFNKCVNCPENPKNLGDCKFAINTKII